MWLGAVGASPRAVWRYPLPKVSMHLSSSAAFPVTRLHSNICSSGGVRTFVKAIPRIRNHRSQHNSEWIKRQISDRYVQRAQECDYRSRSAFKLEQLDDEFLFLRKDRVVLDLGCYPGGWSQVAARRCLVGVESSTAANGGSSSTSRVIGVDIAQMDPYRQLDDKDFEYRTACCTNGWLTEAETLPQLPLVHFIQGRVGDASTLLAVLQELGDQKADVVLSDMAPACTGIRHEDHFNSVELCLYAADLMEQTLCVGGTFVVKIFMGSEVANYKTYLKSRFELVHSAKPRGVLYLKASACAPPQFVFVKSACRKESREMYFVGTGFKGRDKISEEVQIKGSFSAREGYA